MFFPEIQTFRPLYLVVVTKLCAPSVRHMHLHFVMCLLFEEGHRHTTSLTNAAFFFALREEEGNLILLLTSSLSGGSKDS